MTTHAPSYYAATANDPTRYPRLSGTVKADIAIVGGGFTGVNCALELAERGFNVVLVEAQRIGWGATGRNGGQVTGSVSGDAAMLKHLRKTQGDAAADFIWDMRWRGQRIITERVAKYAINCDLKHGHLHTAWKPSHLADLRATLEEATRRGEGEDFAMIPAAELRDWLETPLYHGALLTKRNLHLHSLNLCLGEARAAAAQGVAIYEETEVAAIEHGPSPALVTAQGRIEADAVILAGNAYHRLERAKLGGLLFPAALGNMATAPLDPELARRINPRDVAVYDTRFVLDYYRMTADNRLLFGGGANYSGSVRGSIADDLRPALEATFPALKGIKIDYAWSGQAGIVINRVPLLGRVSPNVWYAQGYSGHGIATSHIVAGIMAEALSGTLERFDVMAGMPRLRVPLSERAGQALLTLGMWYYRFLERLR